jgi:hypothetical protein
MVSYLEDSCRDSAVGISAGYGSGSQTFWFAAHCKTYKNVLAHFMFKIKNTLINLNYEYMSLYKWVSSHF